MVEQTWPISHVTAVDQLRRRINALYSNDLILTPDASPIITGDWAWNSHVDFKEITPPAAPAADTARLYAADEQGAHTFFHVIDASGVDYEIGRDQVETVRADVDLNKGEAVYVSGGTGNVVTVDKAQANDPATASVYGVALEDISANNFGLVLRSGDIFGVSTAGAPVGAELYLDPTVPGGSTITKPTLPNIAVHIGTVAKSSVNGIVEIDPRPLYGRYPQTDVAETVTGQWTFNDDVTFNSFLFVKNVLVVDPVSGSPEGGEIALRDTDSLDGFRIDVTGADSTSDEKLRIRNVGSANDFVMDRDGNVGIGTADPLFKLHVAGEVNVASLRCYGDSTPAGSRLQLGWSQTNAYGWIQTFGGAPLRLNPLGNNVVAGVNNDPVVLETEGTVSTHTVYGSTTAGSHSYGARSIQWRRHGDLIHINGVIQITTFDGTMAGDVRIAGLPQAPAGGQNIGVTFGTLQLGSTASLPADFQQMIGFVSGTEIWLRYMNTSGLNKNLDASHCSNFLLIRFNVVYPVA